MLKDDELHRIAQRLHAVGGVEAVVLGGSRARGTHHDGSDVDLGLYYDAEHLDMHALREVAREIADAPVDVAGPGGWGPWVDGGGWLTIEDTAVDLILRETSRVRAQRDRAIAGEFAFHHQLGHPLGFLDIAYAAEAAVCTPLADPGELVEQLREGLDPYPRALRGAFTDHLVNAEFLLGGAAKAAVRVDVGYIELCCACALLWCAHAWCAEAGAWVTNEKGLIPGVEHLPIDTHGFAARATEILAGIGAEGSAEAGEAGGSPIDDRVPRLATSVVEATELVRETREQLARG
ncbi:nucleotidyltransferase domain-containing protein [Brachybacterium sp. NPDC056505]|uniref:nucleotidyltransferase domain-containing protein n=1 Tax=Brachybacterium sp. NPDC056505 TaxID=3345843 RepID=UPI00366F5577